MHVKAVALDFGHTVIDERVNVLTVLEHRQEHLMPGVRDALAGVSVPIAIWANTRVANAADLRRWLDRAGLSDRVRWIVTSIDAGARKPAREFFDRALGAMQMAAADVLFVGNQRNTDIAGGNAFGVPTVYLTDAIYRSPDDAPCASEPTFTIPTLSDLPSLVARLNGRPT